MRIELKDIDPDIRQRMLSNAYLLQEETPLARPGGAVVVPPMPPHITVGRVIAAIFGTLFCYFAEMVLIGALVDLHIPEAFLMLVFLGFLFATPALAWRWLRTGVLFGRVPAGSAVHPLGTTVPEPKLTPAVVRRMTEIVALPAEQKLYADSLAALLALQNTQRLDNSEARQLLQHLNGLLQSDRSLMAQQRQIEAVLQSGATGRAEQEAADLQKRVDAAHDPVARQTLEQSLEMCQTRLAGLRDLEPLRERVEAQRVVVEQTLASLGATLSHRAMTSDNGALGFDIQGIQETVSRIDRESRSAERAVAEVAALGLGRSV